jgi:molybdate transport system regulatory protein
MTTLSRPKKRRAKANSRASSVTPRVKLWLEADGESVFCRGLSDMLNAVDHTHSIKAAAGEVGRSYRFVWARIKEAEAALGGKLVEAHVGGSGSQRSELTPLAKDLLREFEDVREDIFHLVERVFGERLQATLRKHHLRG